MSLCGWVLLLYLEDQNKNKKNLLEIISKVSQLWLQDDKSVFIKYFK